MPEPGPNASKYSYEEWPVRRSRNPEKTSLHVGRNSNGIDIWTVPDATPEWLEMMRAGLVQKPLPPEVQEWYEQEWLRCYRECDHDVG
jgi:hypothetical protein